jgi:hypothetical protein
MLILWAAVVSLRGENANGAKGIEDFRLEGVAIWQCQCPAYRCPCQHNGLPTEGMCHASDFAHIKTGHYGSVSLDGLNVAMVGNLVDGDASRLFATLYVDKNAKPEQRDALTHIVEYMNGLGNQPPVPVRRIKVVPITFQESEQTEYTIAIPGTLQEKTKMQHDPAGRPLFTMAAMDLWSNTVHNADNVEFRYNDTELRESWDYSNHYANLKYFDVSKKMYAEHRMLAEHGDNSGQWTRRQLQIIRAQGLKAK